MLVMTWQMVGKDVHDGSPEIRTYVLAGTALGIVDQGTSKSGPFTVGNIEHSDTEARARRMAVSSTEQWEEIGAELARTPDFAEIDFDVDDWHLAEYQATDAKQIASAILHVRDRVLQANLRKVTAGAGLLSPSSPVFDAKGHLTSVSFTVTDVDPEVIGLLFNKHNNIHAIGVELRDAD